MKPKQRNILIIVVVGLVLLITPWIVALIKNAGLSTRVCTGIINGEKAVIPCERFYLSDPLIALQAIGAIIIMIGLSFIPKDTIISFLISPIPLFATAIFCAYFIKSINRYVVDELLSMLFFFAIPLYAILSTSISSPPKQIAKYINVIAAKILIYLSMIIITIPLKQNGWNKLFAIFLSLAIIQNIILIYMYKRKKKHQEKDVSKIV